MSLIDVITAMAVTVRNERKKEANSNVRIGDLFIAIIDFIKGVQSGEIRQDGVDTYNDTSDGKTSLLNKYPNPELNWTVLVRNDETNGGKASLYKWNGSKWINIETVVYNDDVAIKSETVPGSYIENEEFIRAYVDSKGDVLWGIRLDSSIYIPKGLPEDIYSYLDNILSDYLTIDEIKQLISESQSAIHEVIDDTEERLELIFDAEKKIVSYREKDGTKVENSLRVENNIELGSKAKEKFIKDLQDSGLEDSTTTINSHFHQLPMPTELAEVNVISDSIPTTKTDNTPFKGYLKYGAVKRKIQGIWNAQGSSSMAHIMKNAGIDLVDESGDADVLKFGNWVPQDSFHWKAFYTDGSKARCNVSYWLAESIYQTRPNGQKRPYEKLFYDSIDRKNGTGKIAEDFGGEALTHPDGFPFALYVNDVFYGIFVWNLKKHRDNYFMRKSNAKHILLDGTISKDSLFGGSVMWEAFEIRNPKDLKTVSGGKYDGDNPTEITGDSSVDAMTAETKGYIERLSSAMPEVETTKTKEVFERYFDVDSLIDYFIFAQVIQHNDGFAKNWLWQTWNGNLWSIGVYDCDLTFGAGNPNGNANGMSDGLVGLIPGIPSYRLYYLYTSEIRSRYKELRDKDIISVEFIGGLFDKWSNMIGTDMYKMNLEKWNETPSYRASHLNSQYWVVVNPQVSLAGISIPVYDESKAYQVGDVVYYKHAWSGTTPTFRCIADCQGKPPLTAFYNNYPYELGYFESIPRLKKWTEERISIVDGLLNYN